MSYKNPKIAEKLHDSLYWYYTPGREIKWGYRAKDLHTEQDFETQEEAYRAFRAYVAKHPGLSEVCSRLDRGSEILVDFDGTIYPGKPGDRYQDMKAPDPICVVTLQQLHNAGHKIVIFSCRANLVVIQDNFRAQMMMEHMERYLREHDIPYDDIFIGKPNYSVVIDDKAQNFNGSWADVRKALEMPDASAPSSQE